MVMPSNNTCWLVHYWAAKYGNLGHLFGPDRVNTPLPHLPYALDNGAFGVWKSGKPWNDEAFVRHVERYAFQSLRPQWVVVPDVVADAEATFAKWREWAPKLREEYHLTLALAVQNGMTPANVSALTPKPDLIFVGGTTEWKWETVGQWASYFPRVHVGRVNGRKRLELCHRLGVESCDGTGWFRGRLEQIRELGHFLREQALCDDWADVDFVTAHSRLKGKDQGCLPLEVPA